MLPPRLLSDYVALFDHGHNHDSRLNEAISELV
jgi:hypothetical protein